MDLRITVAGVALCDFGDAVDGFNPTAEAVQQISTPIRSSEVVLFDRGNVRTTMTFLVNKQHASPTAALAYLCGLGKNLKRQGELVISMRGFGGSKKFTSNNALARATAVNHIGVTTEVTFQVITGILQ